MKIAGSKVLVSGGAGFIGSNLCEALIQQDNEVICLDNLATGHKKNLDSIIGHPKFTFIEGDIRNYDDCSKAVKGCEYVLHQAALGSVPRSINDPMTSTDVNIGGFVKMLFAAKEEGVKRFVYAASSSTYGDFPDLPKHEDKIGKPLSPYAITKYANELFAENFSKIYGIETIGLRYFNVFGPKQDPEGAYAAVIPKFVKSLIRHEQVVINGDGTFSRDFTYIENVIQMNQLAALQKSEILFDDPIKSQVFNVAYGERTSLNQLFDIIRANLKQFDQDIGQIEAVYGPERAGDIPHSLASIEKAQEKLGYRPEYSVRKGLAKAIGWYWENLK